MGKYWGKGLSRTALPATNLGPKPGDSPLGSLESRVAEDKDEGIVLTFEGMPRLYLEESCRKTGEQNEQP